LIGRIIRFVLVAEAIGAFFLTAHFWQTKPFPEALWHGVFLSISAFCNAGFDLEGGFRSITGHDTSILVNVVMMLLIQAGALSYLVFADLFTRRRWSRLALDTKLVLSGHVLLLIGGAAVFLVEEWSRSLEGVAAGYRPMAALFQSVAARTAGFATVNFGEAGVVTLFTWVAIMLIGGASGSTAGGAKISTVAVVFASVISTLRGEEEPTVFKRRIATPLVFRAMSVIALMLLVHFMATLALIGIEDFFSSNETNFISIMFEVMSALALVGLTTGITPDLTSGSKLVLCLVMFIGRLGPLTASYALQRRQKPLRYRLPVAPVRIG
jgi:trk system potassium uptake protein TrkH